jgi:hypothetical protein
MNYSLTEKSSVYVTGSKQDSKGLLASKPTLKPLTNKMKGAFSTHGEEQEIHKNSDFKLTLEECKILSYTEI